jgi:DeoR/GlpR family transcriptional regulator of sugar metabolism
VDHIAEDGTLSVRNEATAHLLNEAVAQSERVIAIVASRPVYGEKRYAVGELQQISSVVTPQVVAARVPCLLPRCGFDQQLYQQ